MLYSNVLNIHKHAKVYTTPMQTYSYDECINNIAHWLAQAAKEPLLLLASGGSSAKVFADVWQRLDRQQQNNSIITLADERYGDVGHEHSNWQLLRALGVNLDDPRHLPVLTGASMEQTTAQWGEALQLQLHTGIPVYAILGIGTDAHIAGLKPNSPAMHETQKLTACYSWEDYERITITPAMFSHITSAVVYAAGEAKQPVLAQLANKLDPMVYPDQLIKQTGNYTLYYQP
jgi:6-phosphogluconolactonase/glucosamine-6-phosphate isomerase/deaminase